MLRLTSSDKFVHISNANELCGILLQHNITSKTEYSMRGGGCRIVFYPFGNYWIVKSGLFIIFQFFMFI